MKKAEKETSEKLYKLSKHINHNNIEKKAKEKKKRKKKPTFSTSEVVMLVVLTSIISLVVSGLLSYNVFNNKNKYNKADENLQSFLKTYEEIKKNYYENVDDSKLIDGAINGMLEKLDDYSVYYNDTESDSFNIKLDGEYEGLGVEIYNAENGDITILDVIDDSPASKAGLKSGDILIKYNDKDIKKIEISKFVDMVKKSDDAKFNLTYIRDNKEKTVTVERNHIVLKSVEPKTYDNDKIGYIYMNVFANNTYAQFKKELEKLESKKIKTLIIDLRNNSGGHLATAEKITSLFLDKTHPIYQIKNKNDIKTYYSVGKEDKEYKIIVLVNRLSASASEIMASALKEQANAILIGEKTFGKGTVQEMQALSTGAQIKLTTKKWLTSTGKKVDKKGIDVDIKVSLDESYAKNPSEDTDKQLQKALIEARK